LKAAGITARVIDLYCVKPIDGGALGAEVKAAGGVLIAVEDHYPEGGLGEAAITAIVTAGILPRKVKHLAVTGMPHSGEPAELVEAFGISARHIVEAVHASL